MMMICSVKQQSLKELCLGIKKVVTKTKHIRSNQHNQSNLIIQTDKIIHADVQIRNVLPVQIRQADNNRQTDRQTDDIDLILTRCPNLQATRDFFKNGHAIVLELQEVIS